MRTLKFRYWNTITKEMVNNPKMPYKENWTIEQLFEDRGWVWMQFTGLTDRHGVEIYDGDILKHGTGKYSYNQLVEYGVIVCHGSEEIDPTTHGVGFDVQNEYCEVIGNIYENPELREAE